MNFVFRLDSSTQIGSGHLMRCLTLANSLREKGHYISFICRDLVGNFIYYLKNKKFDVAVLPDLDNKDNDCTDYQNYLGISQEKDAAQTIAYLKNLVDYLVIDHYALDIKWQKLLRPFVKKIMVIDDLLDRPFDCDVLLNQNLTIGRKNYALLVPKYCQLLLGSQYALVRPEFSDLRKIALKKRDQTRQIKNILVTMGGSDSENLTYQVLTQLDDDFNIVVVLTSVAKHLAMIKDYTKDKKIELVIDSDNMANLMLDADLAIGTAGSTSWERCCLALPSLLYVAADNQEKIAKALEKSGASQIVKNLKDDIEFLMTHFVKWQKMTMQSGLICNGLGTQMIIEQIQNNDK